MYVSLCRFDVSVHFELLLPTLGEHATLPAKRRDNVKEQRKTSRSAEEWRRIVERSQRTDKAQAEFCKAEGVALSTLQLWRKRLSNSAAPARTKPSSANSLPFVEVSGGVRRSHWEMELVMPNGAMMRIPGGRGLIWNQAQTRNVACAEPVDMPKSFTGLIGAVRHVFQADPLTGDAFLPIIRRQMKLSDSEGRREANHIWITLAARGIGQFSAGSHIVRRVAIRRR